MKLRRISADVDAVPFDGTQASVNEIMELLQDTNKGFSLIDYNKYAIRCNYSSLVVVKDFIIEIGTWVVVNKDGFVEYLSEAQIKNNFISCPETKG